MAKKNPVRSFRRSSIFQFIMCLVGIAALLFFSFPKDLTQEINPVAIILVTYLGYLAVTRLYNAATAEKQIKAAQTQSAQKKQASAERSAASRTASARSIQPARVIHTLKTLDQEMSTAGVAHFLSTPEATPFLLTALNAVGARKYLNLWSILLERTGLDLAHLPQSKALSAMYQTFLSDFSGFNTAYRALSEHDPLSSYISAYAKQHK